MPRPRSDYLECRTYRELDRLLYRVLQLNEILRANCGCDSEEVCACNSEKALRLKRRIWRAQKKLERLYASVEQGGKKRHRSRVIGHEKATDGR